MTDRSDYARNFLKRRPKAAT
ncbi:hypothetical protein BOS5A_110460 [Bosea sp. EC-HK365B]|nr:hypothetical protein BOSE46_110204 [Bosea sp. 46]CAD5258775.1 hypothetical protein BOSE21B_110248 [Bosea sp. 21B]CAD5282109.1 hypothetical protein BOSE7B_40967 [Bosea sp. 7B]VVT51819.1 hypothetical protein BOS5A_110460 [Bosea sp. EC-HK365B]VXB42525.1 hypothetical protein BOSE29B_110203 [Bosea sp. 29B]VXC87365.1 hypothetical protein BOSE127_70011 [Bosea sp. 127]